MLGKDANETAYAGGANHCGKQLDIQCIITLWAGDLKSGLKFFTKLQGRMETFVWAGRSQVARSTTTLSKAQGGLGLLLIEEQHQTCWKPDHLDYGTW